VSENTEGQVTNPAGLKLSATSHRILELLREQNNLYGLGYEAICKATAAPSAASGTSEWGAHRGHISRSIRDLISLGLLQRAVSPSGDTYRICVPNQAQRELMIHGSWTECDVCHQSFSDATAMNIHKTKKHPESREQPAEVVNSTASVKEPADDEEEFHIDVDLAEDALAKFSATVDLLRHHEECENCCLKDYLLVLLEDAVHQFMSAGLEPNNDPTTQVPKEAEP